MKLAFEILSHRFGEPRLNSKPEIKNEIEAVFLRPRMDITLLNRDQFVELARADFLARGREAPSPVQGLDGKPTPLMDLRKDGVGMQIGFASSALLNDLLKLQTAHDLRLHPIDVGVYVVAPTALQNYLRKETGKPWTGMTFNEVSRKLPSIGKMLRVPLCLIGLHVLETEQASPYQNINLMSPEQVKEIVFNFLEKRYGHSIDQNVRVMGMGRSTDIEFDGITRLDNIDVIIEPVTSAKGVLHSRMLSDTTRSLPKTLEEYYRLTGRQAALRFILLGEFSPSFIYKILDQRHDVTSGGMKPIIDYETYPLEELGLTDA